MESIRPSSSAYFPEVSDDLGREPGSPYPSQESLPADSYSDTPGSVDQLSQSHQETYLRAAHYTVVHARPGELVQHVQVIAGWWAGSLLHYGTLNYFVLCRP